MRRIPRLESIGAWAAGLLVVAAAFASVLLGVGAQRDARMDKAAAEAADRAYDALSEAVRACPDPARFQHPTFEPAGDVQIAVLFINTRATESGQVAEIGVQATIRKYGRLYSHSRSGVVPFGSTEERVAAGE